jgi:hypothetical protein
MKGCCPVGCQKSGKIGNLLGESRASNKADNFASPVFRLTQSSISEDC